ncbi:MAG: hypothetical protein ACFFBZ_10050 [Promethearchaeota archaeon]
MNDFFSIYVYTPWDKLPNTNLIPVKLISLKSIFKTYPVIEPSFFDDLSSNLSKHNHYSWYESIKRIVGPNKEDYDIKDWNFIWAIDNESRMYQFLFQKITSDKDSQRILVALAPPELGKLFVQYKRDAILRTLSLINNPSKTKFLIVLTPKGKSIVEEQQLIKLNKQNLDQMKLINTLKQIPNIKGQWFPSFEPKCPICNEILTIIKDYKVGFGKIVCPHCGYEKSN